MKRLLIYALTAGLLLVSAVPGRSQSRTLSLGDAVRYAQEHNRDVQVQGLEVEKATQAIREARSYQLPQLNASGTYAYYLNRQVIFLPGAFAGSPEEPVVDLAVGGKNAFNGLLTLNQPLLSTASRQRVKAASLSRDLTQLQTGELRMEVTRQVTVAYYDILLMQERLGLEKQRLVRNEQALADTRSLLGLGRALRVDTLRAFIDIQNLKPAISYLESRVVTAKAALKTLLGVKAEEEIVLSDSLTGDQLRGQPPPDLEQAVAIAFESRPDLQRQALALQLSQTQLRGTQAERLPTISAIGQLQAQEQRDDFRFTQYNWPLTSFVGAQVKMPLFTGLRQEARVQQNKLNTRQDEIRLTYLREKVRNELDAHLGILREADQRRAASRQTVAAAEDSYGLVNDRYRQGLASRLELTDAELALSQAKINHLQAIYDTQVAYVELEKALGKL